LKGAIHFFLNCPEFYLPMSIFCFRLFFQ